MEIIKFDKVSVKTEQKYIIQDFSLTVNEFDKILICGKSGLGKTTLFRLIMGFISPSEGNIYHKGKIIDKNTVWDIRKSISYVPQNLDLTDDKIKDHIKDILSLKVNSSLENNEEDINKLLNRFDLSYDVMDKFYNNLSGGEKQRIAIIMGILIDRELFLLDEITSSLSTDLKEKVINYFTQISNKTVIIISHDSEWLKNDIVKKVNMESL